MLKISIIILTYNRKDLLRKLLRSLSEINYSPLEIIVVDNHSDEPMRGMVQSEFPHIRIIELDANIGVGGRNRGIREATGEILITLDDDVIGINDDALYVIKEIFRNENIGAVCFKIVEPLGEKVCNWCHHYPVETHSERTFLTNEITEGAVAFRKNALDMSGPYPEFFFISHEGPDLAYRIMNNGYNVIYSPQVIVKHYHSKLARKNWRRYYYDTRNLWWLAVRNFPFFYGTKWLFIGLSAMLVYSLRDGYFRYWCKGMLDGIVGLKLAYETRTSPSQRTVSIVKEIEKNRQGFFMMLNKRLFQREVKI